MSDWPDWLPAELNIDDFGGDWKALIEESWKQFEWDFIKSRPMLQDKPVTINRRDSDGRPESYWHVTSETPQIGSERELDTARCKRVCWIRALIEHAGDPAVKAWVMKKGEHDRVHLWLCEEFLVVLGVASDHFVLVTAFSTPEEHRKAKLRRQWEEFRKEGDVP